MATFFEQWLDRRMRITTEKDYIEFVDPVVAQICANTWGDGIGITYAQAAAVTNLNNVFKGNTSIVSFDELQYFTSLTTLNGANSSSTGEFNGCSSLVSITFPSSLTAIGGHAFYGCSSLESVWGGNVTYFGYGCFRECSALLDIDISHATQVYGYAFYHTDLSGKEISMPNLTRFDALAFTGSNISKVLNLGSITSLPDHSYGAGPFSSCTSLTQVTLPSTCGTINRYSFSGCISLTTVTNNSSSFIVRDYAFDGCTSLSSINLNNATSIGAYSFRSTALTNATLTSVTFIDRAAFYRTLLQTVSFGSSALSVGREAFYNCSSLESVTFGGTTTIGSSAFQNCTSLEECTGGTITSFDEYCFDGCSLLVDINISNAVTIGNYAFRNASLAGKTLNITNLTSLGMYSFQNTDIASITSLGSITSIQNGNSSNGAGVFSECTSLTSVTLPNTLTSIGSCAFYNCNSLASINIPTGVTTLGQKALQNCSSLTGILTIPQSITLGASTFFRCSYTKIIFGGDVAGTTGSLNGWLSTLYSSTLLELDFSENQTSEIGSYIVRQPSGYVVCPLTTITVRATTPPPISDYAFNDMNSLAHIYVPASAVDTYKAASVWSGRASIIEAIPA